MTMGLFDKTNSVNQLKHDPINEAGAWVSIMVAAANCNNDITDSEIEVISHVFAYKSIFAGYEMMYYYKPALVYCMEHGSKKLIDSSISFIKEESKECLLCVVLDLITRGGIIDDDEKEIFEYVSTSLNIPQIISEKIVEVFSMYTKFNKMLE